LTRADLRDAYLADANLRGAYLGAAQLQDAELDGARLQGAHVDKKTVWPEGFDWRAAGAVIVQESSE
jgi:uncharacterized protein YjbI with pentapeptide repeats